MIKYIWVILLGILAVQTMAAQNVSGMVLDVKNEPIENVNILILNTEKGTVSDTNGAFSLTVEQGEHTLQLSKLGYGTQAITIKPKTDSDHLVVVLRSSNEFLDEVVVTSQKREQTVQKIPIAITSLNAKRLKETRTWDLKDITGLIPNYTYTKLGVGFQQIQSIRGIQAFSDNPAVATYIDGVNSLDISAGGLQLIDVERIEVLRGPQGTLYGRNALGGVVNIITKRPTNRKEGFYEGSIGNFGLQRHGFGYKTPLIEDKLFFGIAAQYQYSDGFLTNSTEGTVNPQPGQDGRQVGDESSTYGNLFLKWLPNDRWDATLNLKAQLDKSDASRYLLAVTNDSLALANPDKIFLSRVGEHERNLFNSSLAVNYKAGNFKITSVSAYQRIGLRFDDIDFTSNIPNQVYSTYNDGKVGVFNKPQEVFSEEIRISSNNRNERLNYTAGAFYFNQTNQIAGSNARLIGVDSLNVSSTIGKNEGIAFFGEINYSFAEKFTATAGLRYEYENRKSIDSNFNDVNGTIDYSLPRREVSGNYDALLPKFALSYAVDKNQNLYANYTKGFRAGGINPGILTEDAPKDFNPEYSDNFEMGYKTSWFNNRLQVNADVLYINWSNLQFINSFGNFVFATTNVGDARSSGIEMEAIAKPIKGLQLEANLGLLDTEYKNFILSRDNIDPANGEIITELTTISGNQLANAPEHTLFLAVQYGFPVFKNYDLTFRGELKNIGKQYTDIQNDLKVDPYNLINTLVTISNGKYTFSAWIRNLGDERYIEYGTGDTSLGRSTIISEPRTFGATFNLRF